ncbi:hypothetical protein HH308_20525 [Gordonia sp. TBRC 11910]|uniref:Uncharacterized protein n=1 Tax=Gordonia asplenii TaxID=2725283 RepID=A0A848L3H1_9ACTN|nr:hypothetical protein [Gordonia asplenii]NMO03605.1 hypothetical protein [Gordonia asplenii]
MLVYAAIFTLQSPLFRRIGSGDERQSARVIGAARAVLWSGGGLTAGVAATAGAPANADVPKPR